MARVANPSSVLFALIALGVCLKLNLVHGEEITIQLFDEPITFQWCGGSKAEVENSVQLDSGVILVPENISEGQEKFPIRLIGGDISCPRGVEAAVLTLDLTRPSSDTPSTYDSEFSSTGYFRVGNYYYPPEGFCITRWTTSEVVVRVCGKFNKEDHNWSSPKCGTTNPCLPKCCAMNELMTYNEGQFPGCHPKFNNSARLNPILYTKKFEKSTSHKPVFYYRKTFPDEEVFDFINTKNKIENEELYMVYKICFRIIEDGTLVYLNHYDWIPVAPSNYCFEGTQLNNTPLLSSDIFQGNEEQYGFMVNYIPETPRNAAVFPILYATAFLSASVFLLLTFLVYLLLWKDQKIQGWIVMSHSATMFFMYCFSGISNIFEIGERSGGSMRTPSCITFAAVTHFLYLSNFCWLTVTCFSLFWTFRGIAVNPNARNYGLYCVYALFGWGFPLAFVTVALILDQKYSYEPCNLVVVPKYGVEACFVYEGSFGPYVIYPVALLLFLNAGFFSITAYNFYVYQKSTQIARENTGENKQLFSLIAKLFLVMGFTWIFEFIAWIITGASRTWYWAIPDMVNCLQAVAIFIIYVCKSSIAASLRKRYPILIPLLSVRGAIKSTFSSQETASTGISMQKPEVREQEKLLPKNIK